MFTGTYLEFLKLLKEHDYWESEEAYGNYCSREEILYKMPFFDTYTADIEQKLLTLGTGRLYSPTNRPTYPDKTFFEVDTEGFSQEEINQAFGEALKELVKLRDKKSSDEIKAFLFKKFSV